MSPRSGCIIHWFRNDLRIADNPALTAAALKANEEKLPLVACFVVTPAQWQSHDEAPIKLDFLKRSLVSLYADLKSIGIQLFMLRVSDFEGTAEVLGSLVEALDAKGLYFNEEYAVNEQNRDRAVAKLLKPRLEYLHSFRDQTIMPVHSLRTGAGQPYKVFTPFKRSWMASVIIGDNGDDQSTHHIRLWRLPKPEAAKDSSSSDTTLPKGIARCNASADIDAAFENVETVDSSAWTVGEKAAHDQLEGFLDDAAADYDSQRDRPAVDGTSSISRFLANGTLSGRQCYVAAVETRRRLDAEGMGAAAEKGLSTWISELIWRDFYIHIISDFPRVSMHLPFQPGTAALEWKQNDEYFSAWCDGRTGIPIVDAAMRQLNQTGWMHNRLRMVTAMFLTKNLFMDWRLGERYFMRNLIDGFLPSNNGGWQWSASTGTDAAPYFRVFNPVSQSRSHDPDGELIRRYVPEIAELDNKSIHEPSTKQRQESGYPAAIVDLKSSRAEAIERFKSLRNASTS